MNKIAILRKRQVEELTGRSYSSLRRDIARGEFPAPVQIGPRAIGFRADAVYAWVESRPELRELRELHAGDKAKVVPKRGVLMRTSFGVLFAGAVGILGDA